MKKDVTEKSPKSTSEKLGNRFFTLLLICSIVCLLAATTMILTPIVFALGLLLIVATLGVILLIIPGYWSKLQSLPDTLATLTKYFAKIGPYVAGAGILFGVLTIPFLIADKQHKHIGKIISTIILIVFLVFIIVYIHINL